MSGKRLLARTGLVAALGVLIFLVLSSVQSPATPIKPSVQQLLRQSQQNQQPFIPARAGWSESSGTANLVRHPVLESISEEHMRQEFRDMLITVATPDPWFVVALATLVLLMRKLRAMEAVRAKEAAAMAVAEPERETPEAKLAA
jgi:hypothetical protein